MTTLTLWAPGRSLPAPLVAQSTSKKRSSQAQLPQDLKEGLSNSVQLSTFVNSVKNLSNLDIVEISSPQTWAQALQEIEAGWNMWLRSRDYRAGSSLLQGQVCQLSLPSGRVYVADLWQLAKHSEALPNIAKQTLL